MDEATRRQGRGIGPGATALGALLLLGACGGSGGGAGEGPEGRTDLDSILDAGGPGGGRPEGLGPGYATAPGVEACSVDDLKARVDFDLRDYYVYADRVADRSPAEFETPEALIRALRVPPDTFSSVQDFEDFENQVSGRNVGFGFRLARDADDVARFQLVLGGSPAAAAGLERGDALLALDGEPVEGLDARAISTRLQALPEGEAIAFTIRRGDAAPTDVDVAKAAYTVDTVAGSRTFTAAGGARVGYLPILSFASTTSDALGGAFERFAADGVEALVIDVRYNGGGIIDAANRLAVHVAGPNVAGGTFVGYRYNAAYARDFDFDVPFETVGATLGLDRVAVITTGNTASSSELLVNGLRPYVDVRTVGATTFGKAFGSRVERHCHVAINAMRFVTVNAAGESVAGGLAPDCAVDDDWRRPLGDPGDPLSSAAYALLLDGACPDAAAVAAKRGRAPAPEPIWDELPGPRASSLSIAAAERS